MNVVLEVLNTHSQPLFTPRLSHASRILETGVDISLRGQSDRYPLND